MTDNRPPRILVNVNDIPAALKMLRQWVCWRYTFDDKRDKRTKQPYQVTGYLASSTNPKTWNTFDAVLAAYQRDSRSDGIGIVCANRLCGFDLDHCIRADGTWTEAACDIVCGLDSYTEITPSGTGIRVLFWGELPDGWRKNTGLAIECYSSVRYFTVTGQHLVGTPATLQERTIEAAELHARYAPPKSETPPPSAPFIETRREDDDIIRMAGRARNRDKVLALLNGNTSGYPSASEADAALCAALAFYTRDATQIDRIFRRSGLYRPEKWDQRHYSNGMTYGQMTIERALSLIGGAA